MIQILDEVKQYGDKFLLEMSISDIITELSNPFIASNESFVGKHISSSNLALEMTSEGLISGFECHYDFTKDGKLITQYLYRIKRIGENILRLDRWDGATYQQHGYCQINNLPCILGFMDRLDIFLDMDYEDSLVDISNIRYVAL